MHVIQFSGRALVGSPSILLAFALVLPCSCAARAHGAGPVRRTGGCLTDTVRLEEAWAFISPTCSPLASGAIHGIECSRSHVAASSLLTGKQSSTEALATIE